ncbi:MULTISPECIES: TIGR01777 family oxidoreductase [unclassified Vibrio]|uniref:TIGR01777 family oxidoreductase n=1 Tax=Vibrio sp. HB236076 TaxID=3232307 RepID=A0AB39HBL7_9VIBR|nr:TIGR01777 family oxidoreductase [Vibrio sp. HB161653]MDP5254286.1 TIGR01777 family oxidoreductase [Vibrio sp. HB161653]
MKVLITGGTGLIGQALLKALHAETLVVVTRNPQLAAQQLQYLNHGQLSFISQLSQLSHLNDFDAVINLAGEPIADKRWSHGQKDRICQSRWQTTEQLVNLCLASQTPPHTFLSASAVGYYGDQKNHAFDEQKVVHSPDFAHQVCEQWEREALKVHSESTRVCTLRFGIVLSPRGGALAKMLPAYRLGLGAKLGAGKQFMAWIHIQDVVNAILFLLSHDKATGPFNFCSPHSVTQQEFSLALAQALHRPHLLTLPRRFMRILMGESHCLLFDSARAKPTKLTELGFNFQYPHLSPALNNLLQKS